MECSVPPPLTEEEIDALLDNTADSNLMAHIEQCPSCAERLRAAHAFETALKKQLHRWDCPTPDQLADYEMSFLSAPDTERIGKHLPTCAYCQADLQALQAFMADDSHIHEPTSVRPTRSKPNTREQIARIQQNQTPTLRGKSAGPVMATTDTGITLFLELHTEPLGLKVVGQLLVDNLEPWIGALVQAFQLERLTGTAMISDMGEFECRLKDSGPVTLRIHAETQAILVLEQIKFDE